MRNARVLGLLVVSLTAISGCSKKDAAATAASSSSPTPQIAEPTSTGPEAECLKTGDIETCKAAITGAADQEKVFTAATVACGTRNANGCFMAGLMAKNGVGTREDMGRAAEFYGKACDGKHLDGCVMLASMLDEGNGIPEDEVKATKTLIDACMWGYGKACYRAGFKLMKKDDMEANRLGQTMLKKACDFRYQNACEAAARGEELMKLYDEQAGPDDAERPARAAKGSGKPVSIKSAGIEWVVEPELVGRLIVKKASCDVRPTSGIQACDVTIVVPEGWDMSSDRMYARTFDGDGTRTGQFAKGPYLDGTAPGGSVRVRFATMGLDTAKVVFAQE